MPTITHKQALEAHAALLQIAQIENVPVVPTGMAIRRGTRLLGELCEDIRAGYDKLGERHIERDKEGQKVVGETAPDGTPKAWKIADAEAWGAAQAEFYAAEIEVPWSMPASFLTGISLKPALLTALGDLLTEEGS